MTFLCWWKDTPPTVQRKNIMKMILSNSGISGSLGEPIFQVPCSISRGVFRDVVHSRFFFKHFFQSSTFAFFFKKNVWFPIQKDPCPKGPPRQALKECVSTWHLGCEFGIDDGWCREDDEWWYWVDGYHQGYLTARFNFTQLPSMLVSSTGHQSQLRLHFPIFLTLQTCPTVANATYALR